MGEGDENEMIGEVIWFLFVVCEGSVFGCLLRRRVVGIEE